MRPQRLTTGTSRIIPHGATSVRQSLIEWRWSLCLDKPKALDEYNISQVLTAMREVASNRDVDIETGG